MERRCKRLLYSHGIKQEIRFDITLPTAAEIMVAASGSKVSGFTLNDVLVRFETLTYQKFDPDTYGEGTHLAADVSMAYQNGKQVLCDPASQNVSLVWKEDSMVEVYQRSYTDA